MCTRFLSRTHGRLLLTELPAFDRQPHIGPRDVDRGRLPVRHDHARRHPSAQDAARPHAAAQLDHAPVMLNVKRGDAPSDRGLLGTGYMITHA